MPNTNTANGSSRLAIQRPVLTPPELEFLVVSRTRFTFAHAWLAKGGHETDLIRIAGCGLGRCLPRRQAPAGRAAASWPILGCLLRPSSPLAHWPT
jgi:hypothetical protein